MGDQGSPEVPPRSAGRQIAAAAVSGLLLGLVAAGLYLLMRGHFAGARLPVGFAIWLLFLYLYRESSCAFRAAWLIAYGAMFAGAVIAVDRLF